MMLILSPAPERTNFSDLHMTDLAPVHAGLNLLLGGAMMISMLVMIICMCYFCHWRVQKSEERIQRPHYWLQIPESETPVHVFTLENQCMERSGNLSDGGETIYAFPPPDYETVMSKGKDDAATDSELPSYETAIKLSGQGYV